MTTICLFVSRFRVSFDTAPVKKKRGKDYSIRDKWFQLRNLRQWRYGKRTVSVARNEGFCRLPNALPSESCNLIVCNIKGELQGLSCTCKQDLVNFVKTQKYILSFGEQLFGLWFRYNSRLPFIFSLRLLPRITQIWLFYPWILKQY